MKLSALIANIIKFNFKNFSEEEILFLTRLKKSKADEAYIAYLLGIIINPAKGGSRFNDNLEKEVNNFMKENKLEQYYSGRKKPVFSTTTAICYLVLFFSLVIIIVGIIYNFWGVGFFDILISTDDSPGRLRGPGLFFFLIPVACFLNVIHDVNKRRFKRQVISWVQTRGVNNKS